MFMDYGNIGLCIWIIYLDFIFTIYTLTMIIILVYVGF